MRKLLLVVLVGVNLVLAAALIAKLLKLPAARAQPMGQSGNFLMVSGDIMGTNADAVYVVDLERRQLHALTYNRSKRQVSHVGARDLARDLALASIQSGKRPEKTRRPQRIRKRY